MIFTKSRAPDAGEVIEKTCPLAHAHHASGNCTEHSGVPPVQPLLTWSGIDEPWRSRQRFNEHAARRSHASRVQKRIADITALRRHER
eukprot:2407838-Prymnesium_polylepis.1